MAIDNKCKHPKFSHVNRDQAHVAVDWGICLPNSKTQGRADCLGDSKRLQRDCSSMEINYPGVQLKPELGIKAFGSQEK